MKAEEPATLRYLRIKDVQSRLGISRSTIYDRMSPQSPRFDASFPRQVKLGAVSVRWVESEVNEWIRAQIAERERRAEH